jgi:hypothetical protein
LPAIPRYCAAEREILPARERNIRIGHNHGANAFAGLLDVSCQSDNPAHNVHIPAEAKPFRKATARESGMQIEVLSVETAAGTAIFPAPQEENIGGLKPRRQIRDPDGSFFAPVHQGEDAALGICRQKRMFAAEPETVA